MSEDLFQIPPSAPDPLTAAKEAMEEAARLLTNAEQLLKDAGPDAQMLVNERRRQLNAAAAAVMREELARLEP